MLWDDVLDGRSGRVCGEGDVWSCGCVLLTKERSNSSGMQSGVLVESMEM